MTPQRIQRKRTKGWRMPEGAIYVGNPIRWGNPYQPRMHTRHGVEFWTSEPRKTRLDLVAHHASYDAAIVECVARFRADVATRPSWSQWLAELRGHDLVCWCPLSSPCHADVLLELANR